MEYDERKVKPSSTRQLLYEQVLEQSDFCDVIVKIGHWEKLFHWCVLVASPFFASIYKNKFVERQTGIIELRIGTPLMLEKALFFLYGKKPKVTFDNVSDMLELAEFLLIPNLKSACIKWLKTVSVTDENCMKLLELSSVYEFELPKCEEHLRKNLPETMQKDDMVNITEESLVNLLSDCTLSYVPAADWFRFIIRWSQKSQERENRFPELFALIDIEGVDVDFFENVMKKEPLYVRMKNTDEFISKSYYTADHKHRALIIQDSYNQDMIKCLDLDQNRWYRVSMPNDDPELERYKSEKIIAVKGSDFSDVYKLVKRYGKCSMVLTCDLADNHITKSEILNRENNSDVLEIDHIYLSGQYCLAISNKRVNVTSTKDTAPRISPLSLYGARLYEANSLNQFLALELLRGQALRDTGRKTIATSTLYTGTLQESKTELTPLLTIPNHNIESICINEYSRTIAMLSSDKNSLFLFDESSNQLDCIDVKTQYEYSYQVKLASAVNGFVVYNNKNVICISRLLGPALSEKYKVQSVTLEKREEWRQVWYTFCDNQWFRYLRRSYDGDGELSCTSHERLLASIDGNNLDWKPVAQDQNIKDVDSKLFIVSLPKNKLKCHLRCPHCEKPRTSYTSRVDSDNDYYYDDSSSDDYCYYGADSYGYDDYYYYSSD